MSRYAPGAAVPSLLFVARQWTMWWFGGTSELPGNVRFICLRPSLAGKRFYFLSVTRIIPKVMDRFS